MRRSASPSKVAGSTPAKRSRRPIDSSAAVLKTPFKPLSGLSSKTNEHRPSVIPSTSQPQPQQEATEAPTSTARELRARSIPELEQEVAEMELILKERLAMHNAARQTQNLAEQQPEQIVSEYIALLTQYNKVKDAAQIIFDKIADIEQLPAKDIHARYKVGESD